MSFVVSAPRRIGSGGVLVGSSGRQPRESARDCLERPGGAVVCPPSVFRRPLRGRSIALFRGLEASAPSYRREPHPGQMIHALGSLVRSPSKLVIQQMFDRGTEISVTFSEISDWLEWESIGETRLGSRCISLYCDHEKSSLGYCWVWRRVRGEVRPGFAKSTRE